MSDPEHSQPLQLYADAYGGPDLETTSRARQRVHTYVVERRTRRRRWIHRLQGGLGTLLVIAAAYGVWSAVGGTLGGDQPPVRAPAVVTQAQPQTIELPGGGALVVAPQSTVRVMDDGNGATLVEVDVGEIDVDLPAGGTTSRFRAGAYEVTATDAHFTMRRRDGAPRVTVGRGAVTLTGPDLPDAGVDIAAP